MSPYLPRESIWSRGNVGGPEVDMVDKSQVVVGKTLGEGVGVVYFQHLLSFIFHVKVNLLRHNL